MTQVAEAWSMILDRMPQRPIAPTALGDSFDRVLAEPIRAERDLPPFDRATMDGIAISSDAWISGRRKFRICAVQAAGAPATRSPSPEDCIRIMTGAVRPHGTDAVIPIERIAIEGDLATVDDDAIVEPGRFIHRQASDRKHGDIVLEPGIRIGPAEIAVLASAGCATVATYVPAAVAVVSTGDELVSVDAAEIAPQQIRSSNDWAIEASLRRAHLASCSRTNLPDEPDVILESVGRLHDSHDMLILSGGVSMGEFDFVPAALEKLEAEVVFHRIQQKPGKPMWFGISGAGKPIFALPGNPVSTLLCMTRYVVPSLSLASGLRKPAPELACLAEDAVGPADLTWFVPVVLGWSDTGQVLAEPRPTNTSGDFSSLAATDGFMELPPGTERRKRGTIGRIYRW